MKYKWMHRQQVEHFKCQRCETSRSSTVHFSGMEYDGGSTVESARPQSGTCTAQTWQRSVVAVQHVMQCVSMVLVLLWQGCQGAQRLRPLS